MVTWQQGRPVEFPIEFGNRLACDPAWVRDSHYGLEMCHGLRDPLCRPILETFFIRDLGPLPFSRVTLKSPVQFSFSTPDFAGNC